MKKIIILLVVFILPSLLYSQEILFKTALSEEIKETSGLIKLKGSLITHNDSGSTPELYEIDTTSGDIIRRVKVLNATNIDWEDICYDSEYIYVADFGNNYGNRKDLKIYRLSINDYFSTQDNTVNADTINFSYLAQTDFTPKSLSHNFDAEALMVYNDSLYIFSKNWVDNLTYIYSIPKTPGSYKLKRIDTINSQGLVTGSDYNPLANTIILTGYTFFSNFIIEITNFEGNKFSKGIVRRYEIIPPNNSSQQIESIAFIDKNRYYLTSETFQKRVSALLELIMPEKSINENVKIHTSASYNTLTIEDDNFSTVKIYDLLGVLRKESNCNEIHLDNLENGAYIFLIQQLDNKNKIFKHIINK